MVVKRVLKEFSRRSKVSLTKVTVGSLAFQKCSPLLRLVDATDAGEADSRFAVAILVVVVSPSALRLGVVGDDDDDDNDGDDHDDDDDDDDGDDDDDNLGVVGEPGAHVAVGQPVIFAPAGSVLWDPVMNNKVARLFL